MKQCHYSILEVDNKATFDEIRQSYKRLSLKWHPDKNRDNIEEATHRFQLITAAYEVLSDPNERAWYDSHKKKILSERNVYNENDSEYDPLDINLWKYFSRDVFEDFNDDVSGFYTVYSKLFSDIVEEEIKYIPKDKDEYTFWKKASKFGNSNENVDNVMEFYRFWSNFCSNRTFSWKDIWNLNQAQNRQMRRAMESENNKERRKGKKEYNETIKRLVEYVKKRDPRVVVYMKNKSDQLKKIQKEKEEQKKIQEEIRRRMREEARIEELKRMEELELEKKELYGEYKSESDENNDLNETIIYSCKLCNKFFKSEKQLNSHTKSRKHLSKVSELKREKLELQTSKKNINGDRTEKELISNNTYNVEVNESIDQNKVNGMNYFNEDTFDNSNNSSSTSNVNSDSECEFRDSSSISSDYIDLEEITELMDKLNRKRFKNKKDPEEEILLEFTNNKNKNKKEKSKKKSKLETKNIKENNISWKCLVCEEKFDSRNKLFIHIKELNHAQIKSVKNYKNSKVKR